MSQSISYLGSERRASVHATFASDSVKTSVSSCSDKYVAIEKLSEENRHSVISYTLKHFKS